MEELLKAPWSRISALGVLILSTLCPGMLSLALFAPDFFASTDSFKLSAVAIALTLPFLVLNWGVARLSPLFDVPNEGVEERELRKLSIGGFWTIIPLYLPAIWHAFHRATAQRAFFLALAAEIGALVAITVALRKEAKRNLTAPPE